MAVAPILVETAAARSATLSFRVLSDVVPTICEYGKPMYFTVSSLGEVDAALLGRGAGVAQMISTTVLGSFCIRFIMDFHPTLDGLSNITVAGEFRCKWCGKFLDTEESLTRYHRCYEKPKPKSESRASTKAKQEVKRMMQANAADRFNFSNKKPVEILNLI